MWAAFHVAREVLAFRTGATLLTVLAYAGAAACRATVAPLVVLAKAGAATLLAPLALLVMLAEAGAFTIPASLAPLVVWASLVDVPLDWMRRRGIRRCRSCWGRQIHGGEL